MKNPSRLNENNNNKKSTGKKVNQKKHLDTLTLTYKHKNHLSQLYNMTTTTAAITHTHIHTYIHTYAYLHMYVPTGIKKLLKTKQKQTTLGNKETNVTHKP